MLQRSVGPDRDRRRPAMQRDVLAPPDPHPQLQAVQPIQPPHALLIHRPALAPQQHPDAREAEPRPRVRETPECASRSAAWSFARDSAIPRRPTELRQMTGPHAADRRRSSCTQPASSRRCVGLRLFFAGPRSGCVCRATGPRRAASAGAFSSSSDRSCRSSLTPRCAYFFFQM